MKRWKRLLPALLLVFVLCSCRVRTTLLADAVPAATAETPGKAETEKTETETEPTPEASPLPTPEPTPEQTAQPEEEPAPEPDDPVTEDEESERKAYSSETDGTLAPEAEDALYTEAEGSTGSAVGEAGEDSGDVIRTQGEDGELTVTETVAADAADQLGTDENGEVADSVMTYYLTLLDDRVGDLFECKRLYVYWETSEDHRTILKSSPEHQLILGAGAYDVSAKLKEENLTVDDGWVFRKNPDVIVKVLDDTPLNAAAAELLCDELSARADWAEIAAVRDRRILVLSGGLLDTQAGRIAAMVFLAKGMYPEQMSDVDPEEALRALTKEARGSAATGLYAYWM